MYHSIKCWNHVHSLILFILFSSLTIAQAQTPVASFTPDKNTGCAPLLVNFTNTSTGASTYQWHFGNTNNSSILNPTTVYNSPGIYIVTLIAISASGIRDSVTATITVVNNPTASFSVAPLSACEDVNTISFTNLSQNATSYTWDFGDGTTSTATNPTHTYITPGVYGIKLIANNSFGCQDIMIKSGYVTIFSKPSAQFNVNITSSCNVSTVFTFTPTGNNITTWHWNFGDGQTSTQQNPSHQYSNSGTYTVSLIVTNTNGCADTLIKPNYISIGNSLVPSYTMSDTAGCGPLTINFNCTVPNATTWLWNFGDGTTSALQTPSHTYTNPGSYTLSLAVTTQSGCNGSISVPAAIIVDALPIVNFTEVQDSGCVPFPAQFINNSTGATSYLWQFSGGATDTATNPTFIYNNAGLYNVTLHAYSAHGCESVQTVTGAIRALSISAHFMGAPLVGCPGMTVQFNTVNSQTNVISWSWSFGDGTFSSVQNPSHTYTTVGSYNVMLVVVTNFGCTDTVNRRNYVTVVNGQVPYTIPDTFKVCMGDMLSFTDPTVGSDTWNWNFGNGITSNLQSPSYIYPDSGIYTVTLNTSMPGGCSQSFNPYAIVQVISYNPKPIHVQYLNPCKPYTINMSVATPDVVAYLWEFGDGDSSNIAAPTHTYASAGTYSIKLTLTIGAGCRTDVDTTVTFGHTNPIQVNNNSICLHDVSVFTLGTPAAFTNVLWNFADNTTSNLFNPTHTYLAQGTYQPTVITTDTSGCIDTFALAPPIVVSNPIANFSIVGNSTICLNSNFQITNTSTNAATYFWDFGDGTTSTDSFPSHSYSAIGNYTIKLIASTANCSDTLIIPNAVTVVSPTCNFNFTTNGKCMPVTATYTDLSSPVVSWNWNFGDGTTVTTQNPVHTFITAPNAQVSLTVTDIHGCTSSQSLPNIQFYSASALINSPTGCAPFTAQFTDLSTSSISWLWDFGDGTTSTIENPQHIYTANNSYTVTLIATFPGNCIDTVIYPDMITINNPHADFYSPTVAGCSPTSISFVNTSADATSFTWDFGDGSTSLNINPSHVYYIPGTYTIKLIATNSFGCSDTLIKPNYIFIPGTWAHFNLSTLVGCQNLNVAFTDSSINAASWSWNFGDGYTGSIQNANHTYQDTGAFIVTLITQDTLGCSSSYSYPLPIIIHPNPSARGTMTDSTGCSSFTTNFINQSQFASTYLWDFGNGDTSTASDPTYTYLQGGNYQPNIIAITNFGCRDTFNFTTNVNVLQRPTALIAAMDTVSCAPALLQLASASTNTQNPQYNWQLGNGSTATTSSVNASYPSQGNYTAQLIVTNNNGCADSTFVNLIMNPSPVASASADVTQGCQSLPVQFTNTSSGATSCQWYFGNSDSSLQSSPSYIYTQPGIFSPTIIATNQFGCKDTFVASPITVLQKPIVNFGSDSRAGCINSSIQFQDSSTQLLNPSYFWNFGFATSALQNPVINYPYSGIYNTALTITNSNGCSDSLSVPAYIQIFDSLPPPIDPILSVSVKDDSHVEIIWANSSAPDLSSYILYRYNPASASFQKIYEVLNASPAPLNGTSLYTDDSLDTRNTTYTYKLQTTDLCKNTYPLDSLTAHTTINITATASGQHINVSWTPYIGCSVNTYELYRTELTSGAVQLVAILPSSERNYIDTTLSCPYDYIYKVTATQLCGNNYISLSDTSVARPENTLEGQKVTVTRSTVINNKSVLTEWMPPAVHPERVVEYDIFRSDDNSNFTLLAKVPVGATEYVDDNVDVQKQEYYYRVVVVNDCSLSGDASNDGSSIWLQGNKKDFQSTFRWTHYKDWDFGVDHYVLQQQDAQGNWVDIESVGGTVTTVIVDE